MAAMLARAQVRGRDEDEGGERRGDDEFVLAGRDVSTIETIAGARPAGVAAAAAAAWGEYRHQASAVRRRRRKMTQRSIITRVAHVRACVSPCFLMRVVYDACVFSSSYISSPFFLPFSLIYLSLSSLSLSLSLSLI